MPTPNVPAPHFDSPHFWPTRLGFALLRASARLPYRWQYRLGVGLGELMYRFASGRRRIAETNLRLCFPDLSAAELRRLLRENMHATGLGIVEIGTSFWTPDEKLRPLTELRGREHLEAALAQGKGAIMLSFHFTSLELCAHLLARQVPVAAMYRPHPNPLFDAQMRASREADAKVIVSREDVRGTLKALKANLPLWYAADQDYGRKHSIFVPFFGIPAATITATSRFAKLTGAPVVPFTHRRLPGGRGFVLELHPALPGIPSGDDYTDAEAVNRFLESWLRRYPADYMWLHRRFKTRPEGEAGLYGDDQKKSAPNRALSGKRFEQLLKQGRLLRQDRKGRVLSLISPVQERVRIFYRGRGLGSFRARLPDFATAAARLEALGFPVLASERIRFCKNAHCDVVYAPALAGALPLEALSEHPEWLDNVAGFYARLHQAGIAADDDGLWLDEQGKCWIAEPERFTPARTPLSDEDRRQWLASLPEALAGDLRAAYVRASGLSQ